MRKFVTILLTLLCIASPMALTLSAQSKGKVATAMQQTSPIFVLLWVLFYERRAPKKVEVIVFVMVIFGAFILATGGSIDSLAMPLAALILAMISSITCAMYTILPAKLIERYGTFYAVGWGMLLAGICLVGTFITEFTSNTATAAIFFPIAYQTAVSMDANPLTFCVGLMVAVSSSFATPIGSPTHMIVYGPGGYRFSDFARIGIPMNFIIWIANLFITLLLFPL